ncbi:MAG: D-alanine-D-alanine ligase [Gammaproteobacteria bacterium]|jgi:D-alanine-D-alanine ligase
MILGRPLRNEEIVAAAGRVAVVMGGPSAEREISLQSGRAVAEALLRVGIDAREIVWDADLVEQLIECAPDRAFIALHGRGGEDGGVQGLLEVMQIPYTGSDVLGSALCMDKVRAKQVWRDAGIPTPNFVVHCRGEQIQQHAEVVTYPAMVKPAREGSSLGISKVDSSSELAPALEEALRYDDVVLVENWVSGCEYTLAIVAGVALPIIKLETPNEFYDFDAKYVADTTRYLCPCGLPEDVLAQCSALGLRAFAALGARGWGRVDFMLDAQSQPWLIELNTVPGMTDHSLVPMAAQAHGIDFDELVVKILGTSFGDVE